MVWGTREEPLEDILKECSFYIKPSEIGSIEERKEKMLFKVTISVDHKRQLLREFDLAGISEKTLFPGLDGIGQYIERRYRFDYEEFPDYIFRDYQNYKEF